MRDSLILHIAFPCGYAVLVASLWLVQLRQRPVSPRWRGVMSWVSVSLATAALGAWTGTLIGPRYQTIEQSIRLLRHGTNTSLTFCIGAVVTALLAKGRVRKWTAVSALMGPFYYYLLM